MWWSCLLLDSGARRIFAAPFPLTVLEDELAFNCRSLTAAEAKAWQALRIEGARDFPLGFLVTLTEVQQMTLERAATILGGGGTRGVFDGDELVGFCGFRPERLERTRHRAELGPFFVTGSQQGSGAASFLMKSVIDEAIGLGLEQLELFVDTLNHRAIAFYERHGFIRIATHPDGVRIDGVSRDDHFYCLRLTRTQ